MTRTAIATVQRTRDCVWSRPGIRLAGLELELQPEAPWVCVRTGRRVAASEATCEQCPYWACDDFRWADGRWPGN
jgi:hypothetical protein